MEFRLAGQAVQSLYVHMYMHVYICIHKYIHLHTCNVHFATYNVPLQEAKCSGYPTCVGVGINT